MRGIQLTDDQVLDVVAEVRVHKALARMRHEFSYAEIGRRHNISHSAVWRIANGTSRQDLTRDYDLRGEL